MDYRNRRRLKILGRARVVEYDWNCPQHIPVRYSQAEVEAMQARISELEKLLAKAKNHGN